MYVFLYLSVLYAGLPGRPADWLMGYFLLKIKIYLSIYLSFAIIHSCPLVLLYILY